MNQEVIRLTDELVRILLAGSDCFPAIGAKRSTRSVGDGMLEAPTSQSPGSL
jgi:hypothetical protein